MGPYDWTVNRKARKETLLCKVFLLSFLVLAGLFVYPAAEAPASCEEWVAKAVSVQGPVEVRRAGEAEWVSVRLDDAFRSGDMIRVQERGRAAFFLCNETVLRLDQKTALTFTGLEEERTTLLDLLRGAVHFFSRIPRSLKVATPFVNGAVEGTEFYVRVSEDATFLSVFEGRVLATNGAGSTIVISGHATLTRQGETPVSRAVLRPRDAVQWALYYPPILYYRPDDFPGGARSGWEEKVRRSVGFYWEGDFIRAFSSLEGVPDKIPDPRFYIYHAALLLSVGRVDEANTEIMKALALDSGNAHAFALQSIIALTKNEKDRAFEVAGKALDLDPESATARVALSYAQQARFDVLGSLESLKQAVELSPRNPLTWARLAELWLSMGYLERALEAAEQAVALEPHLARTQSVLGFAYLAQIKTEEAKETFREAIKLNQAAPLPRLGLGLARIRDGDLTGGRQEIEIAAGLDPGNALIRSYLGKAYFEEKRDACASRQLEVSKELDPMDPTPWFYDAIRKQTLNRPVEALHDLQKSIELNDNRAVYRSRLLLDQDLAARSASLARIYSDLGFQQLALVEGWRSLNNDPANHSAHRFLSDAYADLPRHEVAKVSELLQAQLLQPLNITPVQPQLAESDMLILEGAGPANPSFNEFNPLFNRNRFTLQTSGVVGENDTLGDELVQSGVWGKISYSIGQFHYESEGFRQNNDQEQDVYNIFVQASLSHKTSVQAEFRYRDTEKGDLPLRFDPENFFPQLREEEENRSLRFGFHHAFSPHSDLIGSVIYVREDADRALEEQIPFPPPFGPIDMTLTLDGVTDGYLAEVQHLYHSGRVHMISGIGHFNGDVDQTLTETFQPQIPPAFLNDSQKDRRNIHHTNLYAYSLINYPKSTTWTVGGSGEFFDDELVERDQFNPKVGVTWHPFADTIFRAAAFRTLKRTLLSSQTLEPTQVAGFNQFYDDVNGSKSWRYGLGMDQRFFSDLHGGVEFSRRDLEVPFVDVTSGQVSETDEKEQEVRIYMYWTPHRWLSLSADYQFERFDTDPVAPRDDMVEIKTHLLKFGIGFFHPSGFSSKIQTSYVDQEGNFGNALSGVVPGDDQFWLVDASIGYRLPRRLGLVTVVARNLFDKEFRFQDTDPANPRRYPERLILGRFTLAF